MAHQIGLKLLIQDQFRKNSFFIYDIYASSETYCQQGRSAEEYKPWASELVLTEMTQLTQNYAHFMWPCLVNQIQEFSNVI